MTIFVGIKDNLRPNRSSSDRPSEEQNYKFRGQDDLSGQAVLRIKIQRTKNQFQGQRVIGTNLFQIQHLNQKVGDISDSKRITDAVAERPELRARSRTPTYGQIEIDLAGQFFFLFQSFRVESCSTPSSKNGSSGQDHRRSTNPNWTNFLVQNFSSETVQLRRTIARVRWQGTKTNIFILFFVSSDSSSLDTRHSGQVITFHELQLDIFMFQLISPSDKTNLPSDTFQTPIRFPREPLSSERLSEPKVEEGLSTKLSTSFKDTDQPQDNRHHGSTLALVYLHNFCFNSNFPHFFSIPPGVYSRNEYYFVVIL
ncbi:hypothetical protein B9Z55_015542 [Caenorhabditis nigoni]|uniref:Uncharacterized protein n=1 Tax=Caenorhabditis nigoni TaxID=1611254 RepID=A0A2G5UBG8_9PELO|nr:hypothetical protein B9Z55_015542 [Caenorhabditis nigoni]